MIADPIGIPACFSAGDRVSDDPSSETTVTRPGQSVIVSVYRTKLANQCRHITITWCRNLLLLHGLTVSISTPDGGAIGGAAGKGGACKVELKPWYFWKKQGSKRFAIDEDGKTVDVFWDLKSAKFSTGETAEPSSEFYVAVVHDKEVILVIGDLKTDAYKKTGCRPALIEPVLVSKKEHVFGKKRFSTRAKFHDKGRFHEILIECRNKGSGSSGSGKGNPTTTESIGLDPEMEVKVDGQVVINVKHLQWKFRGNECIHVNRLKVEVYWDVHDWLFSPGLRHALFIFKPIAPLSAASLASPSSSLSSLLSLSPPSLASTPLSSQYGSSGSMTDGVNGNGNGLSDYSLFLYAWRVD